MNEPPKSFGRSQPRDENVQQRFDPTEAADTLDFASLRGGGNGPSGPDFPRYMFAILLVTTIGILLGAWYFISITLSFKTAVLQNITDIYGPYPDFAVIFVMIPAFCGPFYCLLDYLRLKTKLSPTDPRAIAGALVLFIILGTLAFLPVSLIRHHTSGFAVAHGYVRCSSPFDPKHIRVFALKSYVNTYGCPTYTVGQ